MQTPKCPSLYRGDLFLRWDRSAVQDEPAAASDAPHQTHAAAVAAAAGVGAVRWARLHQVQVRAAGDVVDAAVAPHHGARVQPAGTLFNRHFLGPEPVPEPVPSHV